jgi:hypothetical protein
MSHHTEDYLQHRGDFGYREDNDYFDGIDALYLYSFIRNHQTNRIIEIGQGFSTRLALAALARNAVETGCVPELISVDPYSRLSLAQAPTSVRFSIVRKPLREIASDLSKMLSPGDLLFVDSSHVFKFGSDVQLLFEQVYPQLSAGVRIHIHDIFTPFDYPLEWLTKRRLFWNEQYFLETFLAFNDVFRIEAPLHYLSRRRQVRSMLADKGSGQINPSEGGSLYLLKVR